MCAWEEIDNNFTKEEKESGKIRLQVWSETHETETTRGAKVTWAKRKASNIVQKHV